MVRNRSEDIYDLIEILTQEYFDTICARVSTNGKIKRDDALIIRNTLGLITYHEFESYVQAMGQYEVEEIN